MYAKSFGGVIKAWRLKRDWTQGELAEKAGLSRGRYGNIERGERELTEEDFVRLCLALGVSTKTLYSEGSQAVLKNLRLKESELRKTMGLEPSEDRAEAAPAEDLQQDLDSLLAQLKKVVLHFHRTIDSPERGGETANGEQKKRSRKSRSATKRAGKR